MHTTIGSTAVTLPILVAIGALYTIIAVARRVDAKNFKPSPSLTLLFTGGLVAVGGIWTLRVMSAISGHKPLPLMPDAMVGWLIFLTLGMAGVVTVAIERMVRADMKPAAAVPDFVAHSTPVVNPFVIRQPDVRRVLYIDDTGVGAHTAAMREIFAQRRDINLIPAKQGALGLEAVRLIRPSVILLDMQRPEASCALLLQQLRRSIDCNDIPVIVLTATATPDQIDRILANGAYAHISRPLDIQHFTEILDRVFAVRQVA